MIAFGELKLFDVEQYRRCFKYGGVVVLREG